MRKFLSYLYPVTRKINTQHNGVVEITWYNGKKMLNSAHANYSYDSLQRIMKFGLTKINLKNVNSVLLLGMGGGSVIQTLREDFNFNNKITAVEFDKTIIDIAATEFGIDSGENLEIVQADALKFIENPTGNYDLIIVDLFIDDKVPENFYSLKFWQALSNKLNQKGCFIFNAALSAKVNASVIHFFNSYDDSITIDFFENVNGTNTIIIGNKSQIG